MWTGTVNFTAPDTNTASATSAVTDRPVRSAGLTLSSIALSGEGGYGHLVDWPAVIDFGPAPCGGDAPAPQSFTVTNTSTVDARITSVSITPPNSGFTTSATVGYFFGGGGAARPIKVDAPPVPSPSPLTPITATLTIQTDADSSPHTITLQEEPQGAVLGLRHFGDAELRELRPGRPLAVVDAELRRDEHRHSGGGRDAEHRRSSCSSGADAGRCGRGRRGRAAATRARTPRSGEIDASADATVAGSPPAPFAIATPTFSVPAHGTQTDAGDVHARDGAGLRRRDHDDGQRLHLFGDSRATAPLGRRARRGACRSRPLRSPSRPRAAARRRTRRS